MLHGRGTGGLQVLPPGTTEWQYIKPLKGHAVCNVGDTLGEPRLLSALLGAELTAKVPPLAAVYSGGIL